MSGMASRSVCCTTHRHTWPADARQMSGHLWCVSFSTCFAMHKLNAGPVQEALHTVSAYACIACLCTREQVGYIIHLVSCCRAKGCWGAGPATHLKVSATSRSCMRASSAAAAAAEAAASLADTASRCLDAAPTGVLLNIEQHWDRRAAARLRTISGAARPQPPCANLALLPC